MKKTNFLGLIGIVMILAIAITGCSNPAGSDSGKPKLAAKDSLTSVTANGNSNPGGVTTTQLTLNFSGALNSLSAGDITLTLNTTYPVTDNIAITSVSGSKKVWNVGITLPSYSEIYTGTIAVKVGKTTKTSNSVYFFPKHTGQ